MAEDEASLQSGSAGPIITGITRRSVPVLQVVYLSSMASRSLSVQRGFAHGAFW
jgi:hypothetical protein